MIGFDQVEYNAVTGMVQSHMELGRRIQPIFQDFVRLWSIAIRMKLDETPVAQVGSVAAELSASQEGCHKIGPDLFALKESLQNGMVLELICDFSRSNLKPKRDFAHIVSLIRKCVCLQLEGQTPDLLSVLHRFRLLSAQDQVFPFLLALVSDQYGADFAYIRIKKAHKEAVTGVYSASESDARPFQQLVENKEIDLMIKGQVPQLVVADKNGLKVKNLLVCGVSEQDTFAGLVLGSTHEKWNHPEELHISQSLKFMVAIYHALQFGLEREKQFILAVNENQQVKQHNMEMQLDLADLETRYRRLQSMHDRLGQTLQIWQMMHLYPKGKSFIEKMLSSMRHFLRANTATLCFPDLMGMHLVSKNGDDGMEMLFFSELEGGLYYDLVFKREPVLWDGLDKRQFYLPSGHPRVRNCVCTPVIKEDRVTLVAMVANRQDDPFEYEDLAALGHLINLLQDDLLASFGLVETAEPQ